VRNKIGPKHLGEDRMTGKVFEGVYVVLVTPFKEDESLDEMRMRAHVDRMIKEGVDGVIVGGSTGEFASLSEDEREKLIKLVIEHVDGRVPVIAGSMAPSTKETIRWSKFAEDAGADGLMIVSPYYGSLTNDALYQHFSKVAESVKIPIMPYNNTDTSGNDLVPDIIVRLAEEGKIQYLKECVDTRRMQTIIEKCSGKISVFSGVDDLLFQAFLLGCKGCVSGGANVVPRVVKDLYTFIVKKKNIDEARELWYKYMPLATLFEAPKTWLSNVKFACGIVDDPVGPPRRPLLPPPEETKRQLHNLLRNIGMVS
jgi:4-hydroxy-tetrahydrodipicolinate synthase